MKDWMFIGHRGVGKSTLLSQLKPHFNDYFQFYSLDQEIENQVGMSISDFFPKVSEEEFRNVEMQVFEKLVHQKANKNKIIDMGAGFLGKKPKGWKALWIKRKIDSSQSIFLNRPNLSGHLKITQSRFLEREVRYDQLSDQALLLPEGFHVSDVELKFFKILFGLSKEKFQLERWTWTIQPKKKCEIFRLLCRLGIESFEWRDDLLDQESLEDIDRELNQLQQPVSIIKSFRKKQSGSFAKTQCYDWPLEWSWDKEASIVSLHERKASLLETFKSFPETEQKLKLAVKIQNFNELRQGHHWSLENKGERSFLPMSEEGRWAWYRLLKSQTNPMNFVKVDQGSAIDQPTLLEVLNYNKEYKEFAAILGSPVEHSMTPEFHKTFFRKLKANVFRIDIKKNELREALPVLQELGLRWAAVTSPLKEEMAEILKSDCPSINTITWNGRSWLGINTDIEGIKELFYGLEDQPKVVWGGGGVLYPLKQNFNDLSLYSSRKGTLKDGPQAKEPKVLIWGVGSTSFKKEGVLPPKEWSIEWVVDLNYSQDSPGRICADYYGCQYRSGLDMFTAQAKAQQKFWSENGLK